MLRRGGPGEKVRLPAPVRFVTAGSDPLRPPSSLDLPRRGFQPLLGFYCCHLHN